MSELTKVELASSFSFQPEQLLVARQRLPLDARGYVPLRIVGSEFTMVEPTLATLGGGAVAMSMCRPFGFMRGLVEYEELDYGRVEETQQTDDIVLAPVPGLQDKWMATFNTPQPLSDLDLYGDGISLYAMYVRSKLYRSSLE